MIAGKALAQRPIGIDVSDYQTNDNISWTTLNNTYGISFGWAKASEGISTAGGTEFPTWCANAKAAGVIIGPYHYARYDLNTGTNGAVAEANYFWSVVQSYVVADGLTLVPMLSMGASTSNYSSSSLSQWVNTWCTTVSNNAYAAGLKLKPCVYASSSFASTWLNNSVTKWSPNIAQWHYSEASAETNSPSFNPWPNWTFWQYDDTNAASAYTTGDGDIFNGTLAQLQSNEVVIATGPSITAQPANFTAPPGTNAAFSVTAIGNGTIQYQWSFDGTNIPSATTSNLTLTNVQLSNAGNYSVSVTDSTSNTIQSVPAFLSVVAPLTNVPGSTVVAPPRHGGLVAGGWKRQRHLRHRDGHPRRQSLLYRQRNRSRVSI